PGERGTLLAFPVAGPDPARPDGRTRRARGDGRPERRRGPAAPRFPTGRPAARPRRRQGRTGTRARRAGTTAPGIHGTRRGPLSRTPRMSPRGGKSARTARILGTADPVTGHGSR